MCSCYIVTCDPHTNNHVCVTIHVCVCVLCLGVGRGGGGGRVLVHSVNEPD